MAYKQFINNHNNVVPNDGAAYTSYYIADTDAGKPVTGLNVGDLCWAVDTGILYVATSATTWVAIARPDTLQSFGLVQTFLALGATGSARFYGGSLTPYPVWNLYDSENNKNVYVYFGSPTGTTNITLPTVSCVFGAVGNDADPPGTLGMGKVNKTAQAAAITSTDLTNATPAGLYRISYYLRCTTAGNGTGDVTLNVIASDTIGAVTSSSVAVPFGATTYLDTGTFVKYLASGNITYTCTISGAIGTSKYDVRVRAEYLG